MFKHKVEKSDETIAGEKVKIKKSQNSQTAFMTNKAAIVTHRNRVFGESENDRAVPQRMKSYLEEHLAGTALRGNVWDLPSTSGQLCIQRQLSPKNKRRLKANERFQYIRDHSEKYINPITNTSLVRTIISNVLGKGLNTESNMGEVAQMLGLTILTEIRHEEPAVDRERFSVIPDSCTDVQLKKILEDPKQSEMVDLRGIHYHHIEGAYSGMGKPIWTIDDDGKIRIHGIYGHGNTNKEYINRDGIGQKRITLR